MVIPAKARKEARIDKGDVVSVQSEGDGRLVLIRLEKPVTRLGQVRIIRRKGKHPLGSIGRPVSEAQISEVLAEFP
jgi:bifunctional DNA-binding transcriptional regulator/antitoxin component of YhaV-PrlF toxin-antitoxin module